MAAPAAARGQFALVAGLVALAAIIAVLGLLWASGTLTRWRIENAEKAAAVGTAAAATAKAETSVADTVAAEVQRQLADREPTVIVRMQEANREIAAAPGASALVHPDGFDALMRGVCRNPARTGNDGCAGYGGDAGDTGAEARREP
jgi:hypothetical protein